MGLSNDLISQFAKITQDKKETKKESTVYGTIVKYNGRDYVKMDGSELLTPVTSTVDTDNDNRVVVTIKNHTATVTGNLSSPAARNDTVTALGSKITEFETVVADKVSTKELEAERARIDELVTENATIKGSLTAAEADIDDLQTKNLEVTEKLIAAEAKIDKIETNNLDAEKINTKFLEVDEELEATNAKIYNLEATYGDFNVLTTNKFTAINADIRSLETEKLSTKDAEIKYANIDFANIGDAAIENFLSKSGIIEDIVVSEGHVTGKLVGVTIIGDLIEGGTIKADKLVVLGDDGLYYKLNTNGETISSEQTEYNSLHGSIITAKSITAEKVSVDDLVAFDATIGGFNITDNAIYSGVKNAVDNNTRGIYLDNDGQVAFGDASNFIRYYRGQNGLYKLEISARSIVLGNNGNNIEETFDDMQTQIDDMQIGGRNLIRNSSNLIFTDYQFAQIEMMSVSYDEDGNVTIIYSPLSAAYEDNGAVSLDGVGISYDRNGNVILTE